MLFYKLGDSMATALSTPFYLDMGFTKTDIASIVKAASLWSSITGGFIGGVVMIKIGINRSLWYFGVIQMATILGFAWLAHDSVVLQLQPMYPDLTSEALVAAQGLTVNKNLLFWVVSAEYLGVGLGTAAFVSFIAKSTNKAYTAAQFALLTSLAGIPRTFAASATGYLIESIGYYSFFLLCTALAIPGMLLLFWVAPWERKESISQSTD